MIPRTLFSPEHETLRQNVRRFIAQEILPHHQRWEEQNCVDRAIWNRAGELGLLCMTMPEAYGGAGADRLYSAVIMEELASTGATGVGFTLHSDIVANYLFNFGSEEQKRKWLPQMARGEIVTAIAMTEPGTGSDLQNVKTRAVDDGGHYVLNGSKTFITNGLLADLVVVVAKIGPTDGDQGAKSISLLLVEAVSPGFTKGRPLKKVGMKAQDTCELFFKDVRVPRENLLGSEGGGFTALMRELPWERLQIAVYAVASAEASLERTLAYTRERKVFGQPVAAYQNSRFRLAEMKAEITIARVFVDRCLELVLQDKLPAEDAATAKYWCSDLQCRVIDQCVQLHGGYGYMLEYPIARAWVDSRVQRIYGGTNEIMKEVIARTM